MAWLGHIGPVSRQRYIHLTPTKIASVVRLRDGRGACCHPPPRQRSKHHVHPLADGLYTSGG